AHVRKNAFARTEVGATRIGEHEFTARTIKQLCPQMRLEFGNPPANGRKGRLHLACGSGQAASVDHGQECRHRFQTVHRSPSSIMGKDKSRICHVTADSERRPLITTSSQLLDKRRTQAFHTLASSETQ